MEIKLKKPLKDIYITQPFGVSYVNFYTKLGLKGHNGTDLKAKIGCPLRACHNGVITWAGKGNDGGIGITLANKTTEKGFKTIYYHLNSLNCKKNDKIRAGDIIGFTGNTGKYTTGAHLHIGLKLLYNNKTVNYNNGYKGAIDPAPYFDKNWDKPNAYHRYGRKQDWLAEFKMRFKNIWLHKQLKKRGAIKKIFDISLINALVYGGWGFADVINDAFWQQWAFIKKSEFKKGIRAFKR